MSRQQPPLEPTPADFETPPADGFDLARDLEPDYDHDRDQYGLRTCCGDTGVWCTLLSIIFCCFHKVFHDLIAGCFGRSWYHNLLLWAWEDSRISYLERLQHFMSTKAKECYDTCPGDGGAECLVKWFWGLLGVIPSVFAAAADIVVVIFTLGVAVCVFLPCSIVFHIFYTVESGMMPICITWWFVRYAVMRFPPISLTVGRFGWFSTETVYISLNERRAPKYHKKTCHESSGDFALVCRYMNPYSFEYLWREDGLFNLMDWMAWIPVIGIIPFLFRAPLLVPWLCACFHTLAFTKTPSAFRILGIYAWSGVFALVFPPINWFLFRKRDKVFEEVFQKIVH